MTKSQAYLLKDKKSRRNRRAEDPYGLKKHVDDIVNVIVNNENYKRKLITNNRRSTNTEVYKQVLEQVKIRHPKFPFKLEHMRNKFKWCVKSC